MAIVYVGNLLFIALTIFYQKSNSQARVLPLFTKKHFLKHIARSQSIHEVYIQLSFKFEFEKRRHGMPTAARRPTTANKQPLEAWQANCGRRPTKANRQSSWARGKLTADRRLTTASRQSSQARGKNRLSARRPTTASQQSPFVD